MAKNLALKNTEEPQGLRVARAAEHVASDLDKVIHERLRLGIISGRERAIPAGRPATASRVGCRQRGE